MDFKSSLLRTLSERALLNHCTDIEGLDKLCQQSSIPAYIGFDLTADSLHIGSLIPIMMLRFLQKSGHKPIVLLGTATTKIGDPTGKDEARKFLTLEQIQKNKEGIKSIFEKYLKFGDGPTDAILIDNSEWLDHLNYLDFLREYGRHFSVNRMLSFESVKIRLEREQNLSFLEFNYMILQAYDFLELNKRYNCSLQMGGQDQWGNIVSGTDLIRRCIDKHAFGLTAPLLITSEGKKMGKTEKGAVWLNAEKLSSYEYWQYWRNVHDEDVGKFLRMFTELPIQEIQKLEKLHNSELNEAKIILANEVTALCHGREAAVHAYETAKQVFEQGGIGEDLPHLNISEEVFKTGFTLVEALRQTGLVTSNSEAKRLIRGKGARVNNVVIEDENYIFPEAELSAQKTIKISAGKKLHAMIEVLS